MITPELGNRSGGCEASLEGPTTNRPEGPSDLKIRDAKGRVPFFRLTLAPEPLGQCNHHNCVVQRTQMLQ